jgi:2',3'-cyclic-nucleotide 2'-phosphodiesterase (5'-nucleotidase family)
MRTSKVLTSVLLASLALTMGACSAPAGDGAIAPGESHLEVEHTVALGPGESIISIVGTSVMFGEFGSAAQFAGYVNALRAHHAEAYRGRHSVLVLDAGDAVQGTLTSDFSEGLFAVNVMNAVGYTAAVLGDRGYDFGPVVRSGPIGWMIDKCNAGIASCDPLGAVRRFVGAAAFPFLGANVTERATGAALPELPPFVLVPHDGRTIAILGLENPHTAQLSIPENVAHMDFSDGIEAVRANVEALFTTGKADIFVAVVHEGDGNQVEPQSMRDWLRRLPQRSDGEPLLDAVIAGHSGSVNDAVSAGIPYVQSSNPVSFSALSLVARKGPSGRLQIDRTRTQKSAGIPVDSAPTTTTFFGRPVTTDNVVARIVVKEEEAVGRIANEPLAATNGLDLFGGGGASFPHRLQDSEVGNFLADAMKSRAGAALALLNGSDLRDDITPPMITLDKLFRAMRRNRTVVRTTFAMKGVVENLKRSIETCGTRRALQVSGVHVVFERDCDRAVDGIDPQARLLAVIADDGKLLFRGAPDEAVLVPTIDVVTTDFLMSGGDGYQGFGDAPVPLGTPLLAEVAAFARSNGSIEEEQFRVGRYVNCLSTPTHVLCGTR